MGFDDYVVKPISEGDLHDLVEGLLARARYSMEIQRYAALAAKRATLESQMSPDELDASEGYAELLGELATLRANIDERANDFEEDDYEALFHDI